MKILGLTIVKEIYLPVVIIIITIILEKLLKFTLNKTLNPKKHKKSSFKKVAFSFLLLKNLV